ncbi:hypothetical protein B9T62_18185 [Paenibacillus donghaensis]|uniref:Uncharacterized protein n=1 Tax=Paenibacillus donghaensis TaxID=414771 RepID=A0A2Z2KQE5_9BACL|nr:hypothetical protein B9T62_18185 [Paenibacillus donghaensis]
MLQPLEYAYSKPVKYETMEIYPYYRITIIPIKVNQKLFDPSQTLPSKGGPQRVAPSGHRQVWRMSLAVR